MGRQRYFLDIKNDEAQKEVPVMTKEGGKKKKKAEDLGTLCKLVKKEYMVKHTEEYQQLVKDPRYFCLKCGRAAHDKKSLCRPHKM